MAKVKGLCSVSCRRDFKSCWHKNCDIVKMLMTGKFLITNNSGFIRGVVPADLEFTEAESEQYQEYDLTLDQLGLDAQGERAVLRWNLNKNNANIRTPW